MTQMKIETHMDIIIEKAKSLFWIAITAMASVLSPVESILKLLLATFIFNIFMGIIADIHVNKAKFSINKAFNAFTQLIFFGATVAFLDYAANIERINDPALGITAVKWVTFITLYFYLTNIFKNASCVWPDNKAIQFIYELLSTDIFDKLKNMIGFKK